MLDPFEHLLRQPADRPGRRQARARRRDLHYQVNSGREKTVPTDEWEGGERYGSGNDIYYHWMRGNVTGTKPGDKVKVWFTAGGKKSQSFTTRW